MFFRNGLTGIFLINPHSDQKRSRAIRGGIKWVVLGKGLGRAERRHSAKLSEVVWGGLGTGGWGWCGAFEVL